MKTVNLTTLDISRTGEGHSSVDGFWLRFCCRCFFHENHPAVLPRHHRHLQTVAVSRQSYPQLPRFSQTFPQHFLKFISQIQKNSSRRGRSLKSSQLNHKPVFFHILGISSSQLTNSYFPEGWLNHQPAEGTPKSSILIGFSLVNHPAIGVPP